MKLLATQITLLLMSESLMFAQNEAQSEVAIKFEGATRDALPFVPFKLVNEAGQEIQSHEEGILKLTDEQLKARAEGQKALSENLKANAYQTIVTTAPLAQETTIKAGEYVSQLNSAEEKLNAVGYTLRGEQGISAEERQALDKEKLNSQLTTAAEVYVDAKTAGMRIPAVDQKVAEVHEADKQNLSSENTLYLESQKDKCKTATAGESEEDFKKRCFLANGVSDPSTGSAINLQDLNKDRCDADTPLGKALLVNENWADGGGDKNFEWTANASFKLNTDATGLSLAAKGKADGSVLGKTRNVVDADATFNSPRSGKSSGKIALSLVGKKIFSDNGEWDQSLATSRNSEGGERFVHEEDVQMLNTTFVLGFVPVTIAVSSKVSAGPSYQVDLLPVKILGRAEFIQKIGILAAAGAGVSLDLFEILIGVKGYIDLINSAVGTYPEVSLNLDAKNRPVISARVDARAGMTTLSGMLNIGVWAKTTFSVPQTKSKWPFVEYKPLSYEWKRTLGEYPGYKFPESIIFDKKVGYDICSGKKNVETVVANKPRELDTRADYYMQELQRVTKYEAAVSQKLTEKLADARNEKALSDGFALSQGMESLSQDAIAVSQKVLGSISL